MFKYMKYEIKGSYKVILGILILMLLGSFLIQGSMKQAMNNLEYTTSLVGNNINGLAILLSFLLIFGSGITVFFYILSQFRKDLYEDRGYLTFLLPMSGHKIVGAKFLTAVFWFFILGIGFSIGNVFIALLFFGENWLIILREILVNIDSLVVSIGILSILGSLSSLILIYFSMTLSKITFRNKSIGGMWFVFYLVLSAIVSYTISKLGGLLPYYLDLENFKIVGTDAMSYVYDSFNVGTGFFFISGSGSPVINLFATLLNILVDIGVFYLTGYLIDNKIDI